MCAYIYRYIWARTSDETCKKITVPFTEYGNRTFNRAKITQTKGEKKMLIMITIK